eukprot:67954-Lingulodinium_polyedra.AAC.1
MQSQGMDPVFSEMPGCEAKLFILWNHLDTDGLSMLGNVCFYCDGAQRRYPCWLVEELKAP